MKWNLKRVLSLLLVVCMLMAEVPASVFAAESQSDSTSNSQTSAQNETSSQSNTDTNNVKIVYSMNLQDDYPSLAVANNATMQGIKLANTNNFWGCFWSRADMYWNKNKYGQMKFNASGAGRYNALEVYVPVAGDYNLSIGYGKSKSGVDAEVVVLRDSDTYVASNTQYLVAQGISNAVAEDADNADAANAVNMGVVDCHDASATILTYTNDSVGTVHLEAGKHLIAIYGPESFAYEGGSSFYLRDITLTAGDGSDAALMQMNAEAGMDTLMPDTTTQITATAYLSNPDATGLEFTYISSDNNVATVSDSGVVKAIAEGTATITVAAVFNGKTLKTEVIPITVRNPDLSGLKIVYDLDAYLASGATISDVAFADTHNFWAYKAGALALTANGLRADLAAANDFAAIELNIPAKGTYKLSVDYSAAADGALADVYVIPADTADIAAALTNPVGEVNFYNATAKQATAVVGDVEITAGGNYLLVLKAKSQPSGSTGWKLYPDVITLNDGDAVAVMDMVVTPSNAPVDLNMSTKLSVEVFYSDPSVQGTEVTFKALDKYLEVDNDGNVKVIAAEKTPVNAKIEITAKAYKVLAGKQVYELPVAAFDASGVKLVYKFFFDNYKYKDLTQDVFTYDNNHQFWAYKGDNSSTCGNSNCKVIMHSTYGICASFYKKGEWIALEINVPRAGDYSMSMHHLVYQYGGMGDIYLLPGNTEDIEAALTESNKIGEVNYYDPITTVTKFNDTVFGTVNIPSAGKYLLVSKASASGARGNYYQYIGVVTMDGGDDLMPVEITADTSKSSIKNVEKIQISASAYLSDATLHTGSFKYESLTPQFATVDATGVVSGVAPGNAVIRVSVTSGGKTIYKDVNLTILPVNASGVRVVYDYTAGLSYKQFVRDVDFEKTNGFWSYYHDNNYADDAIAGEKLFIHVYYGVEAQGLGIGKYVALKIKVPEKGDYQINQSYRVYPNGGVADFYILPGDTAKDAIAGALTDPIGRVDFYNPTSEDRVADFGLYNFKEAGEYLLVVKMVSKGGGNGTYARIGTTELVGGSEIIPMNLVVKADKTQLKVSDSLQLDSKLYLTDGTYTTDGITYKSSNSAIAKISKNGVISALKKGKVKITVSAKGVEPVVINLEVLPFNASGISLKFGLNSYLDRRTPVRDVTFADTHDFWQYYHDTIYESDEAAINNDCFIIHHNYGIQAKSVRSGEWFALKIKVPEKGDYLMSLDHFAIHNGGLVDVYVLPGNYSVEQIESAVNGGAAQKVGRVDMYAEQGVYKETHLGAVTFDTAGEYLIVVKGAGKGTNNGQHTYFGSFNFYGGEDTAIMAMEVVSAKSSLKTGETVKLETTCYLSNGELGNYIYQYKSLNSCATVNRAGVVTGAKKGTAKIQVTAVTPTGNVVKTISIPIVTTKPSGAQATYDMLFGLSMYDDVREITYDRTYDTWSYFADGDIDRVRSLDIHTSYGIRFQNNKNDHWLALKIKVEKAGDYLWTQTYGIYKDGGIAGLYIMPGDTKAEEIPELLKTTPMVSEINFFNPEGTLEKVTEALGYVSFPKAGEYVVVYDPLRVPEGGRTWHVYVGNIFLDGVNCLKSVVPEIDSVDLNYGETFKNKFTLRKLDGTIINPKDCTVTYRSSDPFIASVDETGLVKAVGHGTATIEITAYDGVESHTGTYTVNCTDNTGVKKAYIDIADELYVRETALANLVLTMNSGNKIKLPVNETVIKVSDAKKMEVLEGTVTAKAQGNVTITVSGHFLDKKVTAKKTVKIVAHAGKQEATYYTTEMRNNAQINITRYDWAQSIRDQTVKSARMALRNYKALYNLLPEEGLPRSRQVGFQGAKKYGYCRYCDANVVGIYGASGVGGWNIDPIEHPWKIQCKDCLRWFPSNDFGSFYELGLDENGCFDYDKAWAENEKLIAKGQKGYLVNELYPEKGEGWGVDDGYGYRVYTDGRKYQMLDIYDDAGTPISIVADPALDLEQSAVYIALYVYSIWPTVESAISDLSMAYVYTGEIEYARAGAILLDRVADLLPDYDVKLYDNPTWMITDGGSGWGAVQGRIDDNGLFATISTATDALFPALNDPTLLKMLNRMADEVGEKSDKSSSQKIWQNWRDNLLIETWEAAEDGRIHGNFGQMQNAVAKAAVSLAEEPESGMMLEWIYKTDTNPSNRMYNGGDLEYQLIDVVDRDGIGNENSVNYNSWWVKNLYRMADTMSMYEGKVTYNPYEHPKFAQLFAGYPATILSDSHNAQYGDSGSTAGVGFEITYDMYLSAFVAMKDTVLGKRLAQTIYIIKGGDISDLHYDIFTENPNRLAVDISSYVNTHEDKRSELLTGHGYVSIQDGFFADQPSMQSAWMYFGKTDGHGHKCALNLGIEAFGLNMGPDLGYPINTGAEPSRVGWSSTTVSHNTVVVDETVQSSCEVTQELELFDDSDYVKVMSASAPDAYRQTQEYKRTVVMVKVDDDDAYYMDFFRVLGGTHHTYSFHSQSHSAMPMEGLNLEMQIDDKGQMVGTYAGKDVELGETGNFPVGYNYMTKVRKDTNPESNRFTVDFTVTDYRGAISNSKNLHLRMTQINNFTPSEVAIVGGWVPVKKDNAAITEETDTLEYVLTQREGKQGQKLDSLFTTVFEPYRNDSNIVSIEQVPVKVVSGKPGSTDTAVAVMVTQKNGRVDYVFYASNNEITYRVADTFNVNGYVAVYSLNGNTGTEVYRYVTGGDLIVEDTKEVAVYKGTVQNFSTELTLTDNYIDINIPSSAAEDVVGKVIYVENGGEENGAYRIESAKPTKDGVRVYLGTVSLVKAMRDKTNLDSGYIYNIAKGQRFEIPMSYTKCDLSQETKLMFLQIMGHRMNEVFEPEVMDYTCFVPYETRTIDIQAIAAHKNATIKIENGETVYNSGEAEEIPLGSGRNVLEVTVIAEDGMSSRSYFITVSRAQHVCYGGNAYCQEKAICADCERPYGEIDVNNHKEVELWNAVVPTEEADGYSGDYYCVACHLLATKGHVLVYQAPVNVVLILCIAAGVLLAGGAATALIIVSKKKGKPADANPEEDNAPEEETPTEE